MMLAYKYGPYRHNLHIAKNRSEVNWNDNTKTQQVPEKDLVEDSKNGSLRAALEVYQSYLKESLEDRKGTKWSLAELRHAEDEFKGTCRTRRFKSTVFSRKDMIFENTCIEDVAYAYKYCHQEKDDQEEYKLVEVKDDKSVVHYIRNMHELAGQLDIVLQVSARKMNNGLFIFSHDTKHTDFPVVPQVQRINYWFGAVLQQDGNDVSQISFEIFDSISNSFFGHDIEEVRSDYQLLVKTMRKMQSRQKLEVTQQYLSSLTPTQRAYNQFQEYSAEDLQDKNLKWQRTFLNDTRRVNLRITAHTRKMENSCTLVRSNVVFVNADITDVANSITTYFKHKDGFKTHKDLETKKDGSIVQCVRFETGIPFMCDREIVMEATKNEIEDGIFVFNRSVQHPSHQSSSKVITADFWSVAKLEKNGRNVTCESYEYMDCKHNWINDIDVNEHLDNYVVIAETMRKDQSEKPRRGLSNVSNTFNISNLSNDKAFLKFQQFNAEDLTDERLRWSMTKLNNTKKDGFQITCHTRGIEDTVLIRSEISYHKTTVAYVAKAIPICVTKHPTLKKSKVLQANNDGSTVHHLVYEVPNKLIADREIILEIRKKELLDGTVFLSMRNVDNPDIPITRKVVRGSFWCGILLNQRDDYVSSLSFEYLDVKHEILNSFDATSTIDDCKSVIKFLRKSSEKNVCVDKSK